MTRPSDLELMQLADGELDDATAARVEASLDDDGRAKLTALREMQEAVRGHLELRADEVDRRLSKMWGEVEKQVARPAPSAPARGAARRGLWARFTTWLDDHRGHVFTGLVSAGAVAAIMLWLRPGGSSRTVFMPEDGSNVQPVSLKRQAPQVESLDTPEGTTGNVFIEKDDDGNGGTAVILVTPNDVEGT